MSYGFHRHPWAVPLGPVVVIAILALYPQVSLWISRGSEWNGAYYVSNYDETAYSAYVNSLINGRPRKNDPFVGATSSEYESFYSIQFVPAYSIALPARFFGISASSAFIFLSLVIAVSSALALFWLIRSVTQNELLAASGTIVVLCLGTAAAFQGEFRHLLTGRVLIDFLPFLRRYQPGFAFPVFFLFIGMVWRSYSARTRTIALLFSAAAGSLFVTLVFSYFYLWTGAAAWLGIVTTLFMVARGGDRRMTLLASSVIAAIAFAALVPYSYLIGQRSPDADSIQLMTETHYPIFAAPTIAAALLVLAAAGVLAWRRVVALHDPIALFAASCALTPIVLLNQQVITGRSLQPVHYEIFVSNYLVLLSAVLFAGLVLRSPERFAATRNIRKALVYLAVAAALWGFFEAARATSRNRFYADIRDKAIPSIKLIQADIDPDGHSPAPVVLTTDIITGDFVPTVASARALWNPHTSSAGGISLEENKLLFYRYLYYSGFTGKDLREALSWNVFEATAAVFGSERALPALGTDARPVTAAEIADEVSKYENFVAGFSAKEASEPALSYLIVSIKAEPDLSNLDRWYVRDDARDHGEFRLYRLRLRQN
jgi:hypothetical protein